jgi:hypothetical protein
MPRDKFAAMASRAKEHNNVTATGDGGSSISQNQSAPSVAAHTLPRRDKLTALAASQKNSSSNPAASADNPAPAAAQGNSKFAAMAATSGNSSSSRGGGNTVARGNSKLAAMVAQNNSTTVVGPQKDPGVEKEARMAKLKERMSKRRQIFENLDLAEDLTCKLLEIVYKTTNALQDLSSSSPDLAQLSREYRSTLQKIHPLLSTGTEHLVQPYQNHSTETKQSMYAERVEMRLSKERADVLKAFTKLEQEAGAVRSETTAYSTTKSNKRPREDDAQTT